MAADHWSVDDLRKRAQESIEATGEKLDHDVFDRLATRMSYLDGDFSDPATYERVGKAINGARSPVFYLEIPPFLFGPVVKGLAKADLIRGGRVVVEKPFGHDAASAAELADELHQYVDESQLYRIDHFLGKMGLEEVLYLRFANIDARAGMEPELRGQRADHDGRELRGRGPRPLLRQGRGAAGRRCQPPHAAARSRGHGASGRR